MLGPRSNWGSNSNKYKIIDVNSSEIALEKLIEKYFFNEKYHTLCSVVLVKPPNNNVTEDESPAAVDEQPKDNQEDQNEKQEIEISINRFVNSSDNSIKSFNSSRYPYTKEEIEKFFSSNMWQQKEHTLEKSICRPLIGQQISYPFFYYCKEDPTAEYLHLESINHIRFKDPERHKSKLLEYLEKQESKES